ncbi:MAG TPA: polysaccharide biosynthesis tyrosine autokinase [Acidimicrobiales bacterium]|jgi:capsular exopolysaccharide synthesis family protein|nr:polysaccharide biosynthesis tyrosine autokinase [Acidimicrobiales bacterium]
MSLVDALRACRRRWWIPVLVLFVAVVAVFALTPTSTKAQPDFQAKSILLLNPGANQSTSVNLEEATLETTVGAVPKAAAALLHYDGNPTVLAGQVQVSSEATVGTVTIEVTGPDGPRDAQVANAFATALNSNLTQTAVSSYQNQVSSVQGRLSTLQSQINQYNGKTDPVSQARLGAAEDQYRLSYDQFQQLAAQGQPQATFNVLQRAVPVPSGGVHPPRSRLTRSVAAGLVGLLIGVGIVLALELLRPRIQDREEAEREFGTVVLAEIPSLSRAERRRYASDSSSYHLGSFREAYRMLRTAILLIGAPDPESTGGAGTTEQLLVTGPQVILVTSPLPGEGKSTTVANLAVAMAESGRTVLVCNADFRAPQVHLAFGLEPGPGLTDLLTEQEGRSLADLVQETGVPGVSLVHAGKSVDSPAELVATKGARLLDQARALADVVLLDTAPLLMVSDASELLPAVDAVVMVARVGQTTRDGARRSAEMLERAGIPLLGVALVGVHFRVADYYASRYSREGPDTKHRRLVDRLRSPRPTRDVVRVTGRSADARPADIKPTDAKAADARPAGDTGAQVTDTKATSNGGGAPVSSDDPSPAATRGSD